MHVFFEFLQHTDPNIKPYDKNFMTFGRRGKYQIFADLTCNIPKNHRSFKFINSKWPAQLEKYCSYITVY